MQSISISFFKPVDNGATRHPEMGRGSGVARIFSKGGEPSRGSKNIEISELPSKKSFSH